MEKVGKIPRFSEGRKWYPPTGGIYSVSLTVTGERKAAESRAAVLPSPVRDEKDFLKRGLTVKKEFFLPMKLPTKTHQEKKVHVCNGKPVFYEPEELKAVRTKFESRLAPYAPTSPIEGAIRLVTKWCFPAMGGHMDGEWRTTRPDTDNLIKMLKDVMTKLRFWQDDAQVASEITEKFWAEIPGLYIAIYRWEDGEWKV